MVNLYQLHFPSSTFLPLQANTNEGKLKFFYPPTFPSSYNFLSFPFLSPQPNGPLGRRIMGSYSL